MKCIRPYAFNKEVSVCISQVLCLVISIFISCSISAGEIALTFDDAPLSGSSLVSGKDKTEKIISALKSKGVKDALFFVTTKNIKNEESLERLKRYTEEGFHLANHSHSHQSANEMSASKYLADFFTSHLITIGFDGLLKLHRHPYLHQGLDESNRKIIFDGLTDLGYEMGYVTVDNFDWYINSKAVKAYKKGEKIDFNKLKSLYIDVLWETIQFYDSVAKKAIGRSPKHVLLLHENELAALFLGDLIDHIRENKWKIISPQEAYSDPISQEYTPAFQFTKQGRVAAIAHSKGLDENQLRHPSENTDYLDNAFKEYGVIKSMAPEIIE